MTESNKLNESSNQDTLNDYYAQGKNLALAASREGVQVSVYIVQLSETVKNENQTLFLQLLMRLSLASKQPVPMILPTKNHDEFSKHALSLIAGMVGRPNNYKNK